MDDMIQQIVDQQNRLANVLSGLKSHFVGLDEVIDRIGRNIEAWYCMPELMSRPTTVCLWGLTGTGKTDLVRRLVAGLNMQDNFVEIQLTNKGSSQHVYSHTLQGVLSGSNVCPERPGVLLLDEMQRFRSIDQDHKEIHDYRFQDVWMLLSDGNFGGDTDNRERLMEMMFEWAYAQDYEQTLETVVDKTQPVEVDKNVEQDKQIASKRRFKQSVWSARQMKRLLHLHESVDEIMQWDPSKKIDLLREKLDNKSIFQAETYKQLLVFVSGNLDEAYNMASETSETDIDADLFHKHSLRISLLKIKEALQKRFKPEQIARLGNNHVIYPALSRTSFENIIHRQLDRVISEVQSKSGVRFLLDQSIYDAVYRNGVFPTQGTRPVFSTISSFFESAIPFFLLAALRSGVQTVNISYKDKHLCAEINGNIVAIKNEGDIDRIKQDKRNEDMIRKVAVHEAGHAVAYAALFGYAPTQIAAHTASADINGFVGMHAFETSATTLLNQISVFFSGRAAEEMVFGKSWVSSGGGGDINVATNLAAGMVRKWGMDGYMARIVGDVTSGAEELRTGLNETNSNVDEILRCQFRSAKNLVNDNSELVFELSNYLVKHEKISPEEFAEMARRYGLEVDVLDAKETIFPRYKKMYYDALDKIVGNSNI